MSGRHLWQRRRERMPNWTGTISALSDEELARVGDDAGIDFVETENLARANATRRLQEDQTLGLEAVDRLKRLLEITAPDRVFPPPSDHEPGPAHWLTNLSNSARIAPVLPQQDTQVSPVRGMSLDRLCEVRSQLALAVLEYLEQLQSVCDQLDRDPARQQRVKKEVERCLDLLRRFEKTVNEICLPVWVIWDDVKAHFDSPETNSFLDEIDWKQSDIERHHEDAKITAAVLVAATTRDQDGRRLRHWLWKRLTAARSPGSQPPLLLFVDYREGESPKKLLAALAQRFNIALDYDRLPTAAVETAAFSLATGAVPPATTMRPSTQPDATKSFSSQFFAFLAMVIGVVSLVAIVISYLAYRDFGKSVVQPLEPQTGLQGPTTPFTTQPVTPPLAAGPLTGQPVTLRGGVGARPPNLATTTPPNVRRHEPALPDLVGPPDTSVASPPSAPAGTSPSIAEPPMPTGTPPPSGAAGEISPRSASSPETSAVERMPSGVPPTPSIGAMRFWLTLQPSEEALMRVCSPDDCIDGNKSRLSGGIDVAGDVYVPQGGSLIAIVNNVTRELKVVEGKMTLTQSFPLPDADNELLVEIQIWDKERVRKWKYPVKFGTAK